MRLDYIDSSYSKCVQLQLGKIRVEYDALRWKRANVFVDNCGTLSVSVLYYFVLSLQLTLTAMPSNSPLIYLEIESPHMSEVLH